MSKSIIMLVVGTQTEKDLSKLIPKLGCNFDEVHVIGMGDETKGVNPELTTCEPTWAVSLTDYQARSSVFSDLTEKLNANPNSVGVVLFDAGSTDRTTRNIISSARAFIARTGCQARTFTC